MALEKASFTVRELCRALAVSPSGFYASQRRPESAHAQQDRRLRVLVRASFEGSRQRYGSPRILADLREQRVPVSPSGAGARGTADAGRGPAGPGPQAIHSD